MNRPIKFRYRVKDRKEGRVIVYYKTLKEIEAGLVILNNLTYEILSIDEFTGLLDKNGMEIYEGDITNYGEVVWIKQSAGFRINPSRKNDDASFTESLMNHDDILIIGNLYENPELLK